jgi:hypothetical protein
VYSEILLLPNCQILVCGKNCASLSGTFSRTILNGSSKFSLREKCLILPFADKMTQIYPDELGRRTVALSILNQILFPDSHRMIMAASIGSTHMDGHYDGPHGVASCIFEFKDELVDISAIPEVELSAYAARSHKQSIESSQKAKEVFLGWSVPCLGITVVGKLTLHFQMNLA